MTSPSLWPMSQSQRRTLSVRLGYPRLKREAFPLVGRAAVHDGSVAGSLFRYVVVPKGDGRVCTDVAVMSSWEAVLLQDSDLPVQTDQNEKGNVFNFCIK